MKLTKRCITQGVAYVYDLINVKLIIYEEFSVGTDSVWAWLLPKIFRVYQINSSYRTI